jgi:hypothetical protein
VIAVAEFGKPRPPWKPATHPGLQQRDKLTIVARRDGLSDLVRQSTVGE